jgi:GntR family transcriptional regulator
MVATRLESRISAGYYAVASTLPSEGVLAEEFGVSRITVRQALTLLKRRGFLLSRPGVGTIVRRDGANPKAVTISGSIADLVYYSAKTHYLPLDRTLVKPPVALARMFGGERARQRVYRFRGIRGLSTGEAFAVEEVYVPETLGCSLDNRNLQGAPLFSLLEQVNALRIVEVGQAFVAEPASTFVARQLIMRRGAPVLKATRYYRAHDGRMVEIAVSHYDPTRFEYTMKLLPE